MDMVEAKRIYEIERDRIRGERVSGEFFAEVELGGDTDVPVFVWYSGYARDPDWWEIHPSLEVAVIDKQGNPVFDGRDKRVTRFVDVWDNLSQADRDRLEQRAIADSVGV